MFASKINNQLRAGRLSALSATSKYLQCTASASVAAVRPFKNYNNNSSGITQKQAALQCYSTSATPSQSDAAENNNLNNDNTTTSSTTNEQPQQDSYELLVGFKNCYFTMNPTMALWNHKLPASATLHFRNVRTGDIRKVEYEGIITTQGPKFEIGVRMCLNVVSANTYGKTIIFNETEIPSKLTLDRRAKEQGKFFGSGIDINTGAVIMTYLPIREIDANILSTAIGKLALGIGFSNVTSIELLRQVPATQQAHDAEGEAKPRLTETEVKERALIKKGLYITLFLAINMVLQILVKEGYDELQHRKRVHDLQDCSKNGDTSNSSTKE